MTAWEKAPKWHEAIIRIEGPKKFEDRFFHSSSFQMRDDQPIVSHANKTMKVGIVTGKQIGRAHV